MQLRGSGTYAARTERGRYDSVTAGRHPRPSPLPAPVGRLAHLQAHEEASQRGRWRHPHVRTLRMPLWRLQDRRPRPAQPQSPLPCQELLPRWRRSRPSDWWPPQMRAGVRGHAAPAADLSGRCFPAGHNRRQRPARQLRAAPRQPLHVTAYDYEPTCAQRCATQGTIEVGRGAVLHAAAAHLVHRRQAPPMPPAQRWRRRHQGRRRGRPSCWRSLLAHG